MKTSHRHPGTNTPRVCQNDIGIFQAYFINIEKIRGIIEEMQINYDGLSDERKCSLVPAPWNMP
jgi:hypothetical protein